MSGPRGAHRGAHREAERNEPAEDGFTLVELVMTVAIMGVVAAALAGIVLQYLETSGVTEARLVESVDQQIVSAYWQNDVSSIGRRSFVPPAAPAATATTAPVADSVPAAQSVFLGSAGPGACGSSIGSPVVSLVWTEFVAAAASPAGAWDTTVQKAVYVAVPGAGSAVTLQRVRCRNGTAETPQTVARHLTAAPAVSCSTPCEAATPPSRVSLTLDVRDPGQPASTGYRTTLTGDRRQG